MTKPIQKLIKEIISAHNAICDNRIPITEITHEFLDEMFRDWKTKTICQGVYAKRRPMFAAQQYASLLLSGRFWEYHKDRGTEDELPVGYYIRKEMRSYGWKAKKLAHEMGGFTVSVVIDLLNGNDVDIKDGSLLDGLCEAFGTNEDPFMDYDDIYKKWKENQDAS